MGQACCNYSNFADKNALNYPNGKKPEKLDPNLQDLLKNAKENEDKIVKIQAAYRGKQARD